MNENNDHYNGHYFFFHGGGFQSCPLFSHYLFHYFVTYSEFGPENNLMVILMDSIMGQLMATLKAPILIERHRFRWVFCQLEVLRHCFPPSVHRILEELPESLDETYERILKEIRKSNQAHARRMLQCLVVAVRPLRVEELAEVLAFDFSVEGVPKLNPAWRWEDQEEAVMSACSSLVVIIEDGDS